MSTPDLTPVSYVVLGLVARDGPSTPYDIKVAVGRGIAQFWPFPHSQIYAETARLADLGLLAGQQEPGGRRRHVYAITDAGTKTLEDWLAQPSREYPQYRSLGLLQLYFGHFATPEDRMALAGAQLEVCTELLGVYQEIAQRLTSREDRAWQLRVAEMAIAQARAMAGQWAAIVAAGGEPADPAGQPARDGSAS